MKSLKESIFSDVEDIVSSDTVIIEQFLKDNYEIRVTYNINKDRTVDVKGHVKVKNKKIESLTRGLFRFGTVDGDSLCTSCPNLKSLKGAPKEVGEEFHCGWCRSLKNLEGAPEKVGGDFDCSVCAKLTSLEGAPDKVGKYFYCGNCRKLTITDQDRKKYFPNLITK